MVSNGIVRAKRVESDSRRPQPLRMENAFRGIIDEAGQRLLADRVTQHPITILLSLDFIDTLQRRSEKTIRRRHDETFIYLCIAYFPGGDLLQSLLNFQTFVEHRAGRGNLVDPGPVQSRFHATALSYLAV